MSGAEIKFLNYVPTLNDCLPRYMTRSLLPDFEIRST